MLATFNHMNKGTPLVYQGEELGMINWNFTKAQIDDVDVKNYYKILVEE